mgnify:CR=1 FL=1
MDCPEVKDMKKLFLVMFYVILLVGTVSAAEFDNIKSYSDITRTVEVRNSVFGIPFLQLDKVAEMQLMTPTYNKIWGTGYQRVAEIRIDNEGAYDQPLKLIEAFKGNADGEKILNPGFSYKYLTYVEKDVPTYEVVCDKGVCTDNQVGTHKYQTEEWVDFNEKTELPKGEIVIGIYYNDVKEGEVVEWIPTFYGVRIQEWAAFVGASRGEYHISTEDGNALTTTTGSNAQSFLIGSVGTNVSLNLSGFSIKVQHISGGNTFNVSLYSANASGAPNAVLVSNTTLNISDSSDANWFNVTMPPYNMQPGVRYAIGIDNMGDSAMRWNLTSGNSYSDGSRYYSADGNWTYDASDFLFEVWGLPGLTVDLVYPTNTTYNQFISELNYTATGAEAPTDCWYSLDSGGTNTSVTCGVNVTGLTSVMGNNTWTIYANSSANVPASASVDFSIAPIGENSQTFNISTYESAVETFTINISYNNITFTDIDANLIHNGTTYGGIQTGTGNTTTFSSEIGIPLNVNAEGNRTFFWQVTANNGTFYNQLNTSITNQTVNDLFFEPCNTTYTVPYLNFTFKDEDDDSEINASIPTSNFIYYLGNLSLNQTKTFSSTSNANKSYAFCANSNRTLNVDTYLQYKLTSYPQRTYDPGFIELTNVTTNTTLYLLGSDDGIYVTFQVINTAEQPISGVEVNATRSISGTTTIVGEGSTGADGGVTFWLNPDFAHTLSFLKTGYDQYITSITPTQTTYTINLGGATTTIDSYDFTKGITYSIVPKDARLINGTAYSFNYTLSSSNWDVTEYGFVLRFPNGTVIDSVSDAANGGTVKLSANMNNYTRLVMNHYYVITGNYSNGTKTWVIISNEDVDYSIKNFFDRIGTYTTSGLFGLDNFGLNLLIYFLIFGFVGIMSYKFGISNPAAISVMVFSLVALFDFGLGILSVDTTIPAFTNFPTIMMAVITIGLLIREVYR